jgi:hypothetical protein
MKRTHRLTRKTLIYQGSYYQDPIMAGLSTRGPGVGGRDLTQSVKYQIGNGPNMAKTDSVG